MSTKQAAMTSYDYSRLNDKEFEAFSLDLLSEHLGQRIERFKPGKDAGVDGRYFRIDSTEAIIQCKHWVNTGIEALIQHIQKTEASKVAKLNPSLYILITSLPLSRKNKSDICAALAPWLKNPSDIYGKEDLNDLLGKYRRVEERHYKLWFASSTVLKKLLNAPIKGRSEFKIEEAQAKAPRYVVTSAHIDAVKKLEELGTIIVTGEPGIGKSTLAEQLALQYALNDFELCCIADTMNEAEGTWDKDCKQLFYFDDFLGRNYLMALGRHEDSHIIGFIKRVRNDRSKRFILTSRTTVLNRGKQLSDLFKIEKLDRNEYELSVSDLTLLEKAKILYNHVWASELPPSFLEEFFENERYLHVVQHRNFNPRLIEFITDAKRLDGIILEDYWKYILQTLYNPEDVWAHVFENQLSDDARILVKLIVFNGGSIQEAELKEAFLRYIENQGLYFRSDAFYSAIRLSVGAVINRNLSAGKDDVEIELFNPSLGDFIINKYASDLHEVRCAVTALQNENSLENLRSLEDAELISAKDLEIVVVQIAKCLLNDRSCDFDFRLMLGIFAANYDREGAFDNGRFLADFVLEIPDRVHDRNLKVQAELLDLGHRWRILDGDSSQLVDKIVQLMESCTDEESFKAIANFIAGLSRTKIEELTEKFSVIYVDHWQNTISSSVIENAVLEDFYFDDSTEKMENAVRKYISEFAGDLPLDLRPEIIGEILECCDVNQIVADSRNSSWDDSEPPSMPEAENSHLNEMDAIRDLFEKS